MLLLRLVISLFLLYYLNYDKYDRIPIILVLPFFTTKEALIDIKNGALNMRLNDKQMVFRVYKSHNTPSYYRDLCMITTMKVDKCGVEEAKPLISYLDFLMELAK